MKNYDEDRYDFKWYKNKLRKSKFFNDLPITEQSIVLCCCVKYFCADLVPVDDLIPPEKKLEVIEALLKDGTSMTNLWERFVLVAKRSKQFGLDVVMAALKSGDTNGTKHNDK